MHETDLEYSLTYRDAVDILRIVKESLHCESLEIELGGMRLSLTRATAASTPCAAPAAPSAPRPAAIAETAPAASLPRPAQPAEFGLVTVHAPMLGMFYRGPAPDALPFIQVGDAIEADATLGLIEVMKLFSPVHPGVAGRIVDILVDNAVLVEHGQPVALIEPR